MPLHPAARLMLDQLATVEAPRLWDLPIEQVRAGQMVFASIGAGDPVEVGAVEDRTVTGPHGDIPVRVSTPSADQIGSTIPAVVYLHGGGWVFMSIESHDGICRRLAAGSGAVGGGGEDRLPAGTPLPPSPP